ncbi:MAG TPA: ROK family protein [Acidimicrobiia bacterium]|nr:ROK family protein [Acidimicrobiia bacterium]
MKESALRQQGRGVAAEQLRRHNLSTILDRLHLSGPMSRSELAQQTGLNRSTVADLIGELATLALVEEGPGAANTGPGRPSPVAKVRPEGATVLALELSVDSIAVATVGLGGHIYNQIRVARPRGRFTPEETVEDISKLAEPLLGALPGAHQLVGVGVAVAGVVRRTDGFVHLAPNLGWRNVPLGTIVEKRLSLGQAVSMANEADLGSLAEYRRGAGSGVQHLLYLAGEAGIGAGIIQEGRPMLGAAGYAGEVGHTRVNPEGRQCRCGGKGCWETEAGEAALARRAGVSDLIGQRLVEELILRATTGDSRTLEALTVTGRWLGLGIGNLINIFNPDRVVVGGSYHDLYPYLEESMIRSVQEVALSAPGESAEIVPGVLGVDAPLVGAAELALSSVITNPAAATGVHPGFAVDFVDDGG